MSDFNRLLRQGSVGATLSFSASQHVSSRNVFQFKIWIVNSMNRFDIPWRLNNAHTNTMDASLSGRKLLKIISLLLFWHFNTEFCNTDGQCFFTTIVHYYLIICLNNPGNILLTGKLFFQKKILCYREVNATCVRIVAPGIFHNTDTQ